MRALWHRKGGKMNAQLRELKELTDRLPRLEDIAGCSQAVKELPAVKGGPIILFAMWTNDLIAVGRSFAPAGTEMEMHSHKEIETVIVYSGKIEVPYDNGEVNILNPGDVLVIPPNQIHGGRWIESSWAICTTIPPSKGFPDARRIRANR